MSEVYSCVDMFVPVIFIWKYSGLPWIKIEKSHNQSYSVVSDHSVIWKLLLFAITIHTVFILNNKIYVNGFSNFIQFHRIYLTYLENMGIILIARGKTQCFVNLLQNIIILETNLDKVTKIKLVNKKFYRIMMSSAMTKHMLMLVVAVWEFLVSPPELYSELTASHYCWIYEFYVEIFLIYLLIILRRAYTHLNSFLCQQTISSNANVMNDCVSIHDHLHEISIKVNNTFGSFLLLKFLTDLTLVTYGMFQNVKYFLESTENLSEYLIEFIILISWISLVVACDFYIIISFDNITTEVTYSKIFYFEIIYCLLQEKLITDLINEKLKYRERLFKKNYVCLKTIDIKYI